MPRCEQQHSGVGELGPAVPTHLFCTGCVHRLLQFAWGLPHIFITFAKCCYHELHKPAPSSSAQSDESSVSGQLSALCGTRSRLRDASVCCLQISFFFPEPHYHQVSIQSGQTDLSIPHSCSGQRQNPGGCFQSWCQPCSQGLAPSCFVSGASPQIGGHRLRVPG